MAIASWQMVFLTPPIFAVVVFIWSLRLEESLPKEQRSSLYWKSIGLSIKNVITNRIFLRYTTITTFLFTALSSYVASSEHIIGDIYGRPELFPWIFAGIGLLMSLCTFINSKLSSKYGARKTINGLLVIYTVVAAALLLYTLLLGDPPGMAILFIAIAMLLAINIAVEPNSSALAMEPMGEMAGIASAIYGTSFFFIGAALGSVISSLMKENVFPIIFSFFVIGIITLTLAFSDRRSQNFTAR